MNYAALASELSVDPLVRGYAAMTDQQAADSLNVVDRPASVPKSDLLRYVVENAKWKGIADLAASPTSPYAAAAASAVRAFEPGDFDAIDLSRPAVVALIDALVAGGALVAADKTAILAMAENRRSRAAELGLSFVHAGDVQYARAD